MANTAANRTSIGSEVSETIIEIKIKMLDSQTYSLRVDKQMPVPVLKERIATITGVLSDHQRLICRGRVLKDDQLLSAYHVEDGHTLHLVVRQPAPPTAESDGLSNNPASDPSADSVFGRVGPSVVIETFSMPDGGEGVPPEISRIVSAVLGSFGFANSRSRSEFNDTMTTDHGTPTGAADGVGGVSQSQHEQVGVRGWSTFGFPSAVSVGSVQPPVITDSLSTLFQYLSNLRREFAAIAGGDGVDNAEEAGLHRTEESVSSSASHLGSGFPTPASLAEVIRLTRRLLSEQVGECFLQVERHLESQANETDSSARMRNESSARRTGALVHNLGALLLELGRTTMSLRLGQAPSEAIVNAGPALFISSSGPNPLMVQPLLFQGTSFSGTTMGAVQPGSDFVNGINSAVFPRRIDIQIRRGSSTAAAPSLNQENGDNSQRQSGQSNPVVGSRGENGGSQTVPRVSVSQSVGLESGVRVVPIRTVLLGRFGSVSAAQTDAAPGSQPSAAQQPDVQEFFRGSIPSLSAGGVEPSNPRSVSINILSAAGGTQNNQEAERGIPSGVYQLLRHLFPGGEIHVEEEGPTNPQAAAASSAFEQARRSNDPVEVEREEVTDEGIFLSNLLSGIIPYVSQHMESGSSAGTQRGRLDSDHGMDHDSSTQAVGSSHRRREDTETDAETSPPNSKRQKME